MASSYVRFAVCVVLQSVVMMGCGPTGQDQAISIVLDFNGVEPVSVVAHAFAIYESEEECGFVYHRELTVPTYNITVNSSRRSHIQFFQNDVGEAVGELEEGSYAFVGIALDDVCIPAYLGCTSMTLGEREEVVIRMDSVYSYAPYCGLLATCNEGYCPGH